MQELLTALAALDQLPLLNALFLNSVVPDWSPIEICLLELLNHVKCNDVPRDEIQDAIHLLGDTIRMLTYDGSMFFCPPSYVFNVVLVELRLIAMIRFHGHESDYGHLFRVVQLMHDIPPVFMMRLSSTCIRQHIVHLFTYTFQLYDRKDSLHELCDRFPTRHFISDFLGGVIPVLDAFDRTERVSPLLPSPLDQWWTKEESLVVRLMENVAESIDTLTVQRDLVQDVETRNTVERGIDTLCDLKIRHQDRLDDLRRREMSQNTSFTASSSLFGKSKKRDRYEDEGTSRVSKRQKLPPLSSHNEPASLSSSSSATTPSVADEATTEDHAQKMRRRALRFGLPSSTGSH